MKVTVFRESDENYDDIRDSIQYWSNAIGELGFRSENDLPSQVQRIYHELYFEGESGGLRYLVQTPKGFGIALINEYDNQTAQSCSLSMERLFETVIQDSELISKDPLFENAEIYVGEFTGFEMSHELIVIFPWDISKDAFTQAASRLDELAYQTCFHMKNANSLDAKIQNVQKNKSESTPSKEQVDIHLYDLYEYENDNPLVFISLPELMTPEQKVNILQFLDVNGYGCTDQETTHFALEMELWMRNLLCDNSLMINPQHLLMESSIVEGICGFLGENSKNAKLFLHCANNESLLQFIKQEYAKDPDVIEGFTAVTDNWLDFRQNELNDSISGPVQSIAAKITNHIR